MGRKRIVVEADSFDGSETVRHLGANTEGTLGEFSVRGMNMKYKVEDVPPEEGTVYPIEFIRRCRLCKAVNFQVRTTQDGKYTTCLSCHANGDILEEFTPEEGARRRIDIDTPHGRITVLCDPSIPPDTVKVLRGRIFAEQPAPLLPCPFCGENARLEDLAHNTGKWYWVKCCGCSTTSPKSFDTEAEARALWNRRVTP